MGRRESRRRKRLKGWNNFGKEEVLLRLLKWLAPMYAISIFKPSLIVTSKKRTKRINYSCELTGVPKIDNWRLLGRVHGLFW